MKGKKEIDLGKQLKKLDSEVLIIVSLNSGPLAKC